jgi:hypothetical protein
VQHLTTGPDLSAAVAFECAVASSRLGGDPPSLPCRANPHLRRFKDESDLVQIVLFASSRARSLPGWRLMRLRLRQPAMTDDLDRASANLRSFGERR